MRRLFALLAIPLTSASGWQNLRFNQTAPNQVRFENSGLTVAVDHSSSPLVYPLPKPFVTRSATAELEIEGDLPRQTGFPEDAYFRLGLVVPGMRRLSFLERMAAASRVKQLFALVSADRGIDKIYFYELIADPAFVGQVRELPKSKGLMEEHPIAARPAGQKAVRFRLSLPAATEVAALWLGLDGDDSGAKFTVRIKSLVLSGD